MPSFKREKNFGVKASSGELLPGAFAFAGLDALGSIRAAKVGCEVERVRVNQDREAETLSEREGLSAEAQGHRE